MVRFGLGSAVWDSNSTSAAAETEARRRASAARAEAATVRVMNGVRFLVFYVFAPPIASGDDWRSKDVLFSSPCNSRD